MPKPSAPTSKLSTILAKRRWRQPDATEVITFWRGSGLGLEPFCERHDLDAQRLARWAKRLDLADAPTFAEVVVVEPVEPVEEPSSSIVVELGAARVLVERDIDEAHLARVLRVVGAVC